MNSDEFAVFNAEPLGRKIDFHYVGEGDFAMSSYEPARPFMATMGLYICKAVSIYEPTQRRGLLAHVAFTPNVQQDISGLLDFFGDGVEASDVQIVKTQQDRSPCWPTTETIAELIAERNPRNISVDINPNEHLVRSIALDLADGKLYEIDPHNPDQWHGSQDQANSQPIPWAKHYV